MAANRYSTARRGAHSHSVVFGGSRGIGRAIVDALLAMDHRVTVIGRGPFAGAGPRSRRLAHHSLDVSRTDVGQALAALIADRGQITHLLFVQRYRGEADAWAGELATSLGATKTAIERLAPHFDGRAENSILIVGSVAGHMIAEEQPVGYHVAKAGLAHMARYYAVKLGAAGIRVNCLSPGIVLKVEARAFYAAHPELIEMYARIVPRQRVPTAVEIADFAALLCSPGASAITGQNIIADAGLSLLWQESLARSLLLNNIAITRTSQRSRRKR